MANPWSWLCQVWIQVGQSENLLNVEFSFFSISIQSLLIRRIFCQSSKHNRYLKKNTREIGAGKILLFILQSCKNIFTSFYWHWFILLIFEELTEPQSTEIKSNFRMFKNGFEIKFKVNIPDFWARMVFFVLDICVATEQQVAKL